MYFPFPMPPVTRHERSVLRSKIDTPESFTALRVIVRLKADS
ncbi:hypothetical protein TSAR_000343 [Trichomalopsis sarcophagae]|uniref:Uncharacterized protein n=1 Tax=Trichomalopsis sarcophagae TaxID=543379 RepID=A0A232F9D2_9HYME|nr:hypothetical protein TSAR_000343 [Trichomalopsis sarcophagae]